MENKFKAWVGTNLYARPLLKFARAARHRNFWLIFCLISTLTTVAWFIAAGYSEMPALVMLLFGILIIMMPAIASFLIYVFFNKLGIGKEKPPIR